MKWKHETSAVSHGWGNPWCENWMLGSYPRGGRGAVPPQTPSDAHSFAWTTGVTQRDASQCFCAFCFLTPPSFSLKRWIFVVNRTDSKAVSLEPTQGPAFVL